MQDSRDRMKVQPRTAVPITDQTMPRGTTLSAFLVSSANWAGLHTDPAQVVVVVRLDCIETGQQP